MHKKVFVLLAVIGVLGALTYAVVPFRTSAGVGCGSGAGAIGWVTGGAGRQRADATDREARMRAGLDKMVNDPAVANSPMGRELIDDAKDAQGAAAATLAAGDVCDRDAVTRLGVTVLAIVVVLGVVVGAHAVAVVVGRRWRCQRGRGRPPLVELYCPVCAAVLGDPVGCWNCGAFEDGEQWRRPANAPPTAPRRLSSRHRQR